MILEKTPRQQQYYYKIIYLFSIFVLQNSLHK